MQINNVPVSKLSEHKKASKLIPMMTGKEWDNFLESVKKEGVRQPLDINEKYEVLDGRHRLKAAKELEIETLQVIKHAFTDDEAIKFIRDTAIERRSLTPAQRLNIVLETEEVINSIYAKGKEARLEGNKKGASVTNKTALSSMDERPKQPHNSVEQIAEMAKVSKAQVNRIKKLKRENPDAYKEVIEGNKSLRKSYNELPTVVNKQAKKEIERGDIDAKKESPLDTVLEKRTKKQLPPDLSEKEKAEQWLYAQVQTFGGHLLQLTNFIKKTDNLSEVVNESFKLEENFFYDSIEILEITTEALKQK